MPNNIGTTVQLDAKDNTKGVFRKMDKNIQGVGKSTNNLNKGMEKTTGSIKRAAIALVGFTIAAVTLTKATKAAADFEQQMAEVHTLLDVNREGLKDYSKIVDQLVSTYGGQFQSATKALYDSISAGAAKTNGAAGAAKLLNVANRLSIGGVTDLATSTNLLISVLNAYGKSTDEAADVSDILFTTVRGGITTIRELAPSMGLLTPIAASLQVKFSELGAAIATITATGLPTSQAITNIRAAFVNILKPAKEAEEVIESLGIQFFNIKGIKTQGLAGVVLEATGKARAAGLDVEETITKLFGSVEAMNAIMILAADSGSEFTRQLEAQELRAGSTGVAFEKLIGTYNNQADILGGKLKVSFKNFGDTIRAQLIKPIIFINEHWTRWSDFMQITFAKVADAAYFIAPAVIAAFSPFKTGFDWIKQKVLDIAYWFYIVWDKVVGNSYVPDLVEGVLFWFNKWKSGFSFIPKLVDGISDVFANLWLGFTGADAAARSMKSVATVGSKIRSAFVWAKTGEETIFSTIVRSGFMLTIIAGVKTLINNFSRLRASMIANRAIAVSADKIRIKSLQEQAKYIESSAKLNNEYGRTLETLARKGGKRSVIGRILFGSGGWEVAKAQLNDSRKELRKFSSGLSTTGKGQDKIYKQGLMHKFLYGNLTSAQLEQSVEQLKNKVSTLQTSTTNLVLKKGILGHLMFGATLAGDSLIKFVSGQFSRLRALTAKNLPAISNIFTRMAARYRALSTIYTPLVSMTARILWGGVGGAAYATRFFANNIGKAVRLGAAAGRKLGGIASSGLMFAMMMGSQVKQGAKNSPAYDDAKTLIDNVKAKADSFLKGFPTLGLLTLAMFGPVGAIVAATAIAYKHFDLIKEKVVQFADFANDSKVQAQFKASLDAIGSWIKAAPWSDWFNSALAGIAVVGSWIARLPWGEWFMAAAGAIGSAISSAFSAAFDGIASFLGFNDSLTTKAVDSATNAGKAAKEAIKKELNIGNLAIGGGGIIAALLFPALAKSAIVAGMAALLIPIKAAFALLRIEAGLMGAGLLGGPVGWALLGGAAAAIAIHAFWPEISGFFEDMKASVIAWFASWNWSDIWEGLTLSVSDIWANLISPFTELGDSIMNFFKNFSWAGIWEGLGTSLDDAQQKLANSPYKGPVSRASGGILKKANGGFITGPGGPKEDKIPAMLSDGEFVMNAKATSMFGPLLKSMNAQGFANGGEIGRKIRGGADLDSLQISSSKSVEDIAKGMKAFYDALDFSNLVKFVNSLEGFKRVTKESLATLGPSTLREVSTSMRRLQDHAKDLTKEIVGGQVTSSRVSNLAAKSSELAAESLLDLDKHLIVFADTSTAAGKAIVRASKSAGEAIKTFSEGWKETWNDWTNDILAPFERGQRAAERFTDGIDSLIDGLVDGDKSFKEVLKDSTTIYLKDVAKDALKQLAAATTKEFGVSDFFSAASGVTKGADNATVTSAGALLTQEVGGGAISNVLEEASVKDASRQENIFSSAWDQIKGILGSAWDSLSGLFNSITNNLSSIFSSAASSSSSSSGGGLGGLLSGLFGGGGGAYGGSSATLSGAAGLADVARFADGGTPPLNKVSLIGEEGPELFVPRQSGTIIPNEALGGAAPNININQDFNITESTDPLKFQELLVKNNRIVVGMVNEAYRRRGSRNGPGG